MRLAQARSSKLEALLLVSLALVALFPLRGAAQSTTAVPRVVDVAWLSQHVDDVVLLHVGRADRFAAAHIPGARLVSMQDIAASHDDHENDLALELPDPAVARERLQNLGISDDSHVVVYWGEDWVSPATRVVFTLDWLGLGNRVSLLDGGMPAWTAAGHATTDAATPAATAGRISARPVRRDYVVDHAWVRAHAGADGFTVIDARDLVFYDGTEPGNDEDVRGHVPHAVSIPFTSLTNDDGIVRSREELTALFRGAGVEEGDVIAVYCHIGQQGTAIVFAARLIGHDVKLYDGSFQDWAGRELPVELAATGAR